MALSIRKGDTVAVISGSEAGSRGEVLEVIPKKGMAVVEGINMATKHAKAKSQEQPGGIIKQETPIRLSKLMLVDPKTGVAARISMATDDKGNKVRRSKKSNNEI